MREMLICLIMVFAFILCMSVVQNAGALSDLDLLGLWTFDELQDEIVEDTSGKGNDGGIKGDVQSVEGKFGKALKFDGKTGCVPIPDSSSLDLSGDLSFVCWIQTTQVIGDLETWSKAHGLLTMI